MMVGRIGENKLLPSLLDRLTDRDPGSKSESRDSRSESWLDLRSAVLRDLEYLLNTVNLASILPEVNQAEVRDSVLNYGLQSLSGWTVTTVDTKVIERRIKDAIEAFEPRILKGTVTVKLQENADRPHQNVMVFSIEGTLWGQPIPEALFLHTQLDLEKGQVVLAESTK